MATVKAWLAGAFVLMVISAIVGGYWIVTGIIDENKALQRTVTSLENAKKMQDAAIQGLKDANEQNVERVELMQRGLNGLQAAYTRSQQDVDDLRKRYSRITVQRGKDGNVLPASNDALNAGVNDLNRMLREAARGQRSPGGNPPSR